MMNSVLPLTIDAHGGLERWRRFEYVTAHLRTGGVLWALKHQQGVLDDIDVRVAPRREWASHSPFLAPDLRTSFEPHRVAIETTNGRVVDERLQPRDSFRGHRIDSRWDRLHLAYFAGYAMWTYLNTPFLLAMDGVETEELEPWRENGDRWRRLKVIFPESIATHNTVQTLYFSADGLLTRRDYDAQSTRNRSQWHVPVFSGERRWPSETIPSTTQRTARLLVPGFELAEDHNLGLVVEGGDDFVGVLFRVVKSQAADREIDDFMTVPRSRPG